jgi:catechol 2,3-dioxygenase-like lactoylglutathione lyase family enzyme
MHLAKNFLDVGLHTNQLGPMLRFWQEDVGLPFEEMLPTGGGNRQHRHGLNGAVLKLNHARDPLPPTGPSGYRELMVARDGIAAPRALRDPDGNLVTLVPPGHEGVSAAGIRLVVRNVELSLGYYRDVLGWQQVGDAAIRCGETVLFLTEDPTIAPTGDMRGIGYRYLTVQVWDCDSEHGAVLERGGTEGRPPITLGTTARFSFVRDPDGNWLEISQRASLTGALPENG